MLCGMSNAVYQRFDGVIAEILHTALLRFEGICDMVSLLKKQFDWSDSVEQKSAY